MSTNSIIARPEGASWQGTFCIWNGAPRDQLPALRGLVQVLGLSLAREWLVESGCYWSILGADIWDCQRVSDKDWDLIPQGQSNLTQAEWVYVLHDDGIRVIKMINEQEVDRGVASYDSADEDTSLECGSRFEDCSHYAWAHFDEVDPESRVGARDFFLHGAEALPLH